MQERASSPGCVYDKWGCEGWGEPGDGLAQRRVGRLACSGISKEANMATESERWRVAGGEVRDDGGVRMLEL